MSFEDPTASMVDARAFTAALLDAQGRTDEALGWYASLADGVFPVNPVFEGPYLPWAYERRARIHDAAGDAARARSLYVRFLEVVADPEPALQLLLDETRARVEVLEPS